MLTTLLRCALHTLSSAVQVDCLEHPPRTSGPQRLAIVLVDDALAAGTQSRDALEFQLVDTSNPLSLASLLLEVSYGKFQIVGSVYPPAGAGFSWYHHPGTIPSPGALHQIAVDLSDADVDYATVDRLLPIVPRPGFYGGPGLVTLQSDEGCIRLPVATAGNGNAQHGWVLPGGNGATFNLGHEFGHTLAKDASSGAFQITHSIAIRNTTGVVYTTNPADYVKSYYGMGFMFPDRRHPDVMVKDELGWLDTSQLAEIRKNGVFVIPLRAVHATKNGRVQCVKVARSACGTSDLDNECGGGNVGWYYLEYRSSDGTNEPMVFVYVDAWRRTLAQQSHDIAGSTMLTLFPTQPPRYGLRVGETYVCPVLGTRIEVQPSFIGADDVTLRVTTTALPLAVACAADISGPGRPSIPDGVVDSIDVQTVRNRLGPCPGGPGCLGDVTGSGGVPDGQVDLLDLNFVATSQGPCIE